ncbi:alpha/beta hydrolase [Vagococcus fluvialis]|uniref:Alpha/beta hydrolase n=1 Tax=Vagococcus fluvialis TaxID=2738 RepID=A0A7X6I3K1_9ENTE|nr:alpha/beta hydrolase [Vagococcus fluvialis]NKC68556.1 alpha/beta hydrolase [Vagococcus fluvialis]
MNTIKKIKNIVYGQSEVEYHTADVYLPLNATDVPMVIAVHGGAYQAGAKEMYDNWGRYFAENGIACMSINYTLATPTKSSYKQIQNDVNQAIQFVVKNAAEWNVNPNKIGFVGDSAGAHLGTLASFGDIRSSAKVRFVICVYGVMDVVEWYYYTNKTRKDFVVNKLFGNSYETDRDVFESISPIHLIDNVVKNPMFDTSFYMIWGEDDKVVIPENQTIPFIKKLEEFDIYHEKKAVPGEGHFWFTKNTEDDDGYFENNLAPEIAPELVNFIFKVTGENKKSDPNSDK